MDLNEPECACDGRLKSTPTVNEFSPSTGQPSSVTATSKRSTGRRSNPSTSSAVASRANRSVAPGSNAARQITATSGQTLSAALTLSGPLGSLVKMCLASSTWHSTQCVLTWKTSATPSGRLVYRLVPSVPRTSGSAFGFWPTIRGNKNSHFKLWPTPTLNTVSGGANDQAPTVKQGRHGLNLSGAVRLWPTPDAHCWKGGERARQLGGQLNPNWVELLMGYPAGWTDLPED